MLKKIGLSGRKTELARFMESIFMFENVEKTGAISYFSEFIDM